MTVVNNRLMKTSDRFPSCHNYVGIRVKKYGNQSYGANQTLTKFSSSACVCNLVSVKGQKPDRLFVCCCRCFKKEKNKDGRKEGI